jgi:hypothetical protein
MDVRCATYSIWIFMCRYIMPLSGMTECTVVFISGGGGRYVKNLPIKVKISMFSLTTHAAGRLSQYSLQSYVLIYDYIERTNQRFYKARIK